jgi:hypothetical protein
LLFRLFWSFSFVGVGSLVASAIIVFSSGTAGISAGIWGILVGPCVHVDIGEEVVCSGGGVFLARVADVSATGEDAQARELTGLITGMSGHGGDVGFSTWGAALELEACSAARGALREKSKLEIKIEKQEMTKEEKETYPAAKGLCFL